MMGCDGSGVGHTLGVGLVRSCCDEGGEVGASAVPSGCVRGVRRDEEGGLRNHGILSVDSDRTHRAAGRSRRRRP